MAKTAAAKKTNPVGSERSEEGAPVSLSAGRKPREGFQKAEQRFETSGFWMPERGSIVGVVLGAYEYKQKSGRGKGQKRRVFVFRLLEPCIGRVKLDGGGFDETTLDRGETVGVFYSAGMRELNTCLGCAVDMVRNPENMKKETDRGAMWTFEIDFRGTRRPVPVRPALESEREENAEDASFDPSEYADAF